MMGILKSLFLFIWAAWLEIAGGYLIWQWAKGGKAISHAIIGTSLLCFFGITLAMQAGNFGKIYAAYGGIFIAMSVMWGWGMDGIKPDKYDAIGAVICIIGACIIMFMPRK